MVVFSSCEKETFVPVKQEAITQDLSKNSSLYDQIAASTEFKTLITTYFFDYGYGLDPAYPHGSRPQSSYTKQEVADMYQISTGDVDVWYQRSIEQFTAIISKYPNAADFVDSDWSIVADKYMAANNDDENLANAGRKNPGCVGAAGARYFTGIGSSLGLSTVCPPCGVATFLVSAGIFAYEYSNC